MVKSTHNWFCATLDWTNVGENFRALTSREKPLQRYIHRSKNVHKLWIGPVENLNNEPGEHVENKTYPHSYLVFHSLHAMRKCTASLSIKNLLNKLKRYFVVAKKPKEAYNSSEFDDAAGNEMVYLTYCEPIYSSPQSALDYTYKSATDTSTKTESVDEDNKRKKNNKGKRQWEPWTETTSPYSAETVILLERMDKLISRLELQLAKALDLLSGLVKEPQAKRKREEEEEKCPHGCKEGRVVSECNVHNSDGRLEFEKEPPEGKVWAEHLDLIDRQQDGSFNLEFNADEICAYLKLASADIDIL